MVRNGRSLDERDTRPGVSRHPASGKRTIELSIASIPPFEFASVMTEERDPIAVAPASTSSAASAAHATHARSELARGLAALLAVQVFFVLFPVVGKLAFAGGVFTPAALAFWRIAAGAAVLGGLAFLRLGRAAIPPRLELPRLVLLSLL